MGVSAPPPSSPSPPPTSAGPLRGRRVVVTRAAAVSGPLVERLAGLGAEVQVVALIASAPPADGGAALTAAVGDVVAGHYEWLVVSSPTGARRVVEALDGRTPAASVCAVGPGTATILEAAGVAVDLMPGRHVGEGLVVAFPDAPVGPSAPEGPSARGGQGAAGSGRVVVVRAAVARNVVPDGLGAKGWEVDVVEAYRTVVAPVDAAGVAALSAADVVTLTSSSTADALADVAASTGVVPGPVACIGPVTAATATARGLDCVAVADPHSLDGLVDAVVAAVGRPVDAPGPGDGARGTGS
jgi:uroporphyrinogen-III synthase